MRTIDITYKRSARAKSVRIAVTRGGSVTVTYPWWSRRATVDLFIQKHKAWIEEKVEHFKSLPPKEKRPRSIYTKKHYREHREQARALAEARLAHFNRHYGFSYKSVSIKNTKTRWGSCSSKGNLNFNYKILFLSPESCDYVIVHELCHLKEMNHGPKFWKLVSETIPEWKTLRTSIKKGLL